MLYVYKSKQPNLQGNFDSNYYKWKHTHKLQKLVTQFYNKFNIYGKKPYIDRAHRINLLTNAAINLRVI